MGNTNNSQNQKFQKVLDESYNYVTLQQHPIFGEIKIYKNSQTGKKIAHIHKQIYDSEDLQIKMSQYQKRSEQQCQFLLKVYDFQEFAANDLCSQIKYFSIKIEYYEQSIRNFHSKYTEKELYYLIFSLCEALEYCKLQENDITDLHPQKILITEDGQIKLIDKMISIDTINNFNQIKYNYRSVEYLAPEQLDLFTQSKKNINQEKVNVFCLGLLLVELITKYPTTDYYLEDDAVVNYKLLFQRLDQKFIHSHYSENLQLLIKQMLSINIDERLDYKSILAQKQYHHFVSNLDGDSIEYTNSYKQYQSIQSPPNGLNQNEYQTFNQLPSDLIQSLQSPNNNYKEYIDNNLQERINNAVEQSNKLLEQLEEDSSQPLTKLQSKNFDGDIFDSVQNPLVQLTESRIKRLIQNSEIALQQSQF